MQLIDTHCHIHEPEFYDGKNLVRQQLADAKQAGVVQCICVGTTAKSSQLAVEVAVNFGLYASLAIHPHEVELQKTDELEESKASLKAVANQKNPRVVAIGECGLDYYYHESKQVKDKQKQLLIWHLELAKNLNLPVIFHIRNPKDQDMSVVGEAFLDLAEILTAYPDLEGVIHSFSSGPADLELVMNLGLFVGVNGIATFSKDSRQIEAYKSVGLSRMVLETDSPFLTPKPFRGTMCEPKHIRVTAEFISELKGVKLAKLAKITTQNAQKLFRIKL